MSNFYPENYHDGDSEDQENVVWNERDWYQYLSRNKREIRKLIECYKRVKNNHSGYLEELTKLMGWTNFAFFDSEEQVGEDSFLEVTDTGFQDEEELEVDLEPYTIHKNPLNIFSMGLYQFIQEQCEELLGGRSGVSAINIWRLSTSLNDGQSNILMATYSIDIADYMLAICHLKLALKAINESLHVVGQLSGGIPQVREISMALFALREVFIKISNDCREYDQSELGDAE